MSYERHASGDELSPAADVDQAMEERSLRFTVVFIG